MMEKAGVIFTLKPIALFCTLSITGFALTACKTEKEAPSAKHDNSAAIALLQKVNSSAHACWVKSKDKDFRAYRIIPELDTRVGIPRILILKAKATQGLPQYVIEAKGTPAKISTYGPLASDPLAARINKDIARWRTGNTKCTA